MKVPMEALLRIRDVLAKNEAALRVMYVELHQPGACEKWVEAMEARVDFEGFVLNPVTIDVQLDIQAVAP